MTNALEAASEFDDEESDDFQVIFDGAGTQWVPELADEDHDLHSLYDSVTDHVVVCSYCADAYEVAESVEESDAELVSEYEGHPSVRDLVADGYEVVTY